MDVCIKTLGTFLYKKKKKGTFFVQNKQKKANTNNMRIFSCCILERKRKKKGCYLVKGLEIIFYSPLSMLSPGCHTAISLAWGQAGKSPARAAVQVCRASSLGFVVPVPGCCGAGLGASL